MMCKFSGLRSDGKLDVLSANFKKALEGDAAENILLEPKDRVFIHKNLAKTDPPVVTIEGEIARPGKYPFGQNLSAAGLFSSVGRSEAWRVYAGSRPDSLRTGRREQDRKRSCLGSARGGPLGTSRCGCWLGLRPRWRCSHDSPSHGMERPRSHDKGGRRGHVSWNLRNPRRRTSELIIQRAGGFRRDAYPYGAVLERVAVEQLQEQDRADLIRRVKGERPP